MWTTIDEEGREHLTKVHQVDCKSQQFSKRRKQFICRQTGELCSETCVYYSGLRDYINDYEKLPINGVEVNISMMWKEPNIESRDFVSVDENSNVINDSGLLDYLKTEIWVD